MAWYGENWKVIYDWEYDEDISEELNRERLEKRIDYLRDYANKNWMYSIHAPGCAARAEYLEALSYSGEDLNGMDEMEAWYVTESMMEDHMYSIMEEWLEYGIHEAYERHGYQWMLWATGHDINGVHEIVSKWCKEEERWAPEIVAKVRALMNSTWHYED